MFINFWYPVVFSRDLADKPLHVTMLGCEFVAFRDSTGQPQVLANTCVHRGGSLAHGKVKGDRIECPYHGWQYGGDGVCRKIPALGSNGRVPARAAVDAYPVQERWGLVFAFLGDLPEAERPPIINVTEWDDPAWRGTWLSWEWDANCERAVENSMDPSHNEFVHFNHGFQGERDDYRVPEMRLEESEWGTDGHMSMLAPAVKRGNMKELKTSEGMTHATTGHRGPHQLWNQLHITERNWMHMYQYTVPVTAHRTRFFHLTMRNNWLQPENDARLNERNIETSEEDRAVLQRLRPIVAPDSRARELLTAGDELVGRYRQALGRWTARGWKIDVDRSIELGRRAVLTIPSPARREHGNWVQETVPLIPAESAAALVVGSPI